jgi:hypothetical protein
MSIRGGIWSVLSLLAIIVVLAVSKSVGQLASQIYAEVRQPAVVSQQEFLERFEATLSNNELMRIFKRAFPDDYSKFLNAVYAQYRDGGDLEVVKALGYSMARSIRIREGELALKAREEDILAIFSKKLSTLRTAQASDHSLCVKYIRGDNKNLTMDQLAVLGLENESILVFKAIESGQAAQRSYAELTDDHWERILFGNGSFEFSDDELNAIFDPKFLVTSSSELVCRSWTKLYEAVGRQELDIRVKFMVSMMRDALRH